MGCTNCGKSTRYEKRTGDIAESEKYERVHDLQPTTNTFLEELNSSSFEQLEEMKKSREVEEYNIFISSAKKLSDDLKASQIATFVDIVNGDKFSPHGQTSEYCLTLLHKLLVMPEFEKVNKRFPNLKQQIDERYESLCKVKIKLS
jgi:hypothetical protein